MGGGLRYFGGAVAFGFAAVWIMWSLPAALVCLLSAAGGYCAILAAERARARLAARAGSPGFTSSTLSRPRPQTPEAEALYRRADELNHDLGHVYEPSLGTPPRAAEADGAPFNDAAVTPTETGRREAG